jgi:hypothetical protein
MGDFLDDVEDLVEVPVDDDFIENMDGDASIKAIEEDPQTLVDLMIESFETAMLKKELLPDKFKSYPKPIKAGLVNDMLLNLTPKERAELVTFSGFTPLIYINNVDIRMYKTKELAKDLSGFIMYFYQYLETYPMSTLSVRRAIAKRIPLDPDLTVPENIMNSIFNQLLNEKMTDGEAVQYMLEIIVGENLD